jgi:hypothetical protein
MESNVLRSRRPWNMGVRNGSDRAIRRSQLNYRNGSQRAALRRQELAKATHKMPA